jgi:hypothetical protein
MLLRQKQQPHQIVDNLQQAKVIKEKAEQNQDMVNP